MLHAKLLYVTQCKKKRSSTLDFFSFECVCVGGGRAALIVYNVTISNLKKKIVAFIAILQNCIEYLIVSRILAWFRFKPGSVEKPRARQRNQH